MHYICTIIASMVWRFKVRGQMTGLEYMQDDNNSYLNSNHECRLSKTLSSS